MNKIEEKAPQVTVADAEAETSTDPSQTKPRFRILNMLPLYAFLEFLGAILVVVGAAILVACINGHIQWGYHYNVNLYWANFKWSGISPQTILSLTNSAATFLIALALKEGIDIAWWRRAMKGSTVEDLEKRYRVGNCPSSALFAGRSFGVIALATIAAAVLGFTQGSLMQSALSVELSSQRSTVNLTTNIAKVLPDGYTGRITEHDYSTSSFLTADFNEVMKQYKAAIPIKPIGFSGCAGTCRATIRAAGLAPECKTNQEATKIIVENHCKGRHNEQCSVFGGPFQLFQSRFDYSSNVYAQEIPHITMKVSYVDTEAYETQKYSQTEIQVLGFCPGRNTTHTCILRPAIVEYPVIIQNNSVQADVITLDTGASPFFNVVDYKNVTSLDYQSSTIGGVQLALDELFDSVLEVNYIPTWIPPWSSLGSIGSLGGDSVNLEESGGRDMDKFLNTCKVGFNNPVPRLLDAVNQIMFRTAISAAAASPNNHTIAPVVVYHAEQTIPVNRYLANYYYLGAALGITVLCVALMLPTFWGYWELERKMTLNPIELAEAFNAPVLRTDSEHKNLDDLMHSVGARQVQWTPAPVQLSDERTVVRRTIVEHQRT